MNKQGPGKIDYCDFSLNIVRGPCKHNCSYCYMRAYWNRFKPELEFKYPANAPRKKPAVIFIGSSTDMWGEWVPGSWIEKTINYANDYPQHTYLFLTKNPERYFDYNFPSNFWIGTTFDGLKAGYKNLVDLTNHKHPNKWVSLEPLKASLTPWELMLVSSMKWVVIGADSTKGVDMPPELWGHAVIEIAKEFNIPVWVKDNWPELPKIKERPF